jgi:hypothetical protein
MSRLPRLLLSFWVDPKRPKQRPQFTHGSGLKRDLSNAGVDLKFWGSPAMTRNLWHAITQQKNVHCNSNGGGYAWMDAAEYEVTSAECILPSQSSYEGVILGLPAASVPNAALKVCIQLANSNSDLVQPT